MNDRSPAARPSPSAKNKDQGLPQPAASIEAERLVEQAAEAAPLPDDALPADIADVRGGGFTLRDKLLNLRSLASFALAFVLLFFVFRTADVKLSEVWEALTKVNLPLFVAAFAAFYALFPVRALRWRILLRSAGFDVDTPQARHGWASVRSLGTVIGLSWFANCVVPAKLGDAYRGYLIRKNSGASFSRTFGTIFAERIIDMIVLFGLLVVSGLLVFRGHLGDSQTKWVEALFIVGVLLTVVLIVGLMSMRFLSPFIRRIIPNRFHDFYARFEEGTLASFRPGLLPGLLLLSVIIWLGEAYRLYLVVLAIGGVNLSLSAVIFVALASSLLTAVPALPGGIGLVEGGMIGVLGLLGVSNTAGAAITLLDRIINFWSIIIIGFVLYLWISQRAPQRPTAEAAKS